MVSVKIRYWNKDFLYHYSDMNGYHYSINSLAVWLRSCFQSNWSSTITSIEFQEKYCISNEQLNQLKAVFHNHSKLEKFLENVELIEIDDYD